MSQISELNTSLSRRITSKGEQLDTTGLKLIATYENGRVSELTDYETNRL